MAERWNVWYGNVQMDQVSGLSGKDKGEGTAGYGAAEFSLVLPKV